MAKAKKPLTDRTILSLKAAEPGKRRIVWDALIPGLGVRVTDRGGEELRSSHPLPRLTQPRPTGCRDLSSDQPGSC